MISVQYFLLWQSRFIVVVVGMPINNHFFGQVQKSYF